MSCLEYVLPGILILTLLIDFNNIKIKSDPSPSKIPGSETLLNGYSRALPLLLALNDITIQKHGTDIRW